MRLLFNYKGINKILEKVDSYEEVVKFVNDNFFLKMSNWHMIYIDSDGDKISLDSQLDVDTMFSTTNRPHLKVYIKDDDDLDQNQSSEEDMGIVVSQTNGKVSNQEVEVASKIQTVEVPEGAVEQVLEVQGKQCIQESTELSEKSPFEQPNFQQKPSDSNPFAVNPDQSNTSATNPFDFKPTESKPFPTNPFAVNTSATNPFDSKPTESRPFTTNPFAVNLDQSNISATNPFDSNPFVPRLMTNHKMDTENWRKQIMNLVDERIEHLLPSLVNKIQSRIKSDKPKITQTVGVKHDVKCSGCGIEPILGIRYKCMSCPLFNYCSECENTLSHDHNLLKMKFPAVQPEVKSQQLKKNCTESKDLDRADQKQTMTVKPQLLAPQQAHQKKEQIEICCNKPIGQHPFQNESQDNTIFKSAKWFRNQVFGDPKKRNDCLIWMKDLFGEQNIVDYCNFYQANQKLPNEAIIDKYLSEKTRQ